MLFQEVLNAKNKDSLSKFFKKPLYKTVTIPLLVALIEVCS